MSTTLKWDSPLRIADEYAAACSYKAGLGQRGLFEQCKVNERFYTGDQWHGVNASAERPLVRENIIKRIGDFKMSVIGAAPVTVSYSADGVPNTLDAQERIGRIRRDLAGGLIPEQPITSEEEINLVMAALSDYFRVTAERVRFDELKSKVLRQAYISGTGLLYTYWDDRLQTGLYADEAHTVPIVGDIRCEVADIENVCFGDPTNDDLQEQPYILVAQRRRLDEIRLEMKRLGRAAQAAELKPDDGGEDGTADDGKATVITKFYREWDEDGRRPSIKAVRVCGKTVVRPAWDLGVRLYPLAKFEWEPRRKCIYGESEITHLIPNQIAINRMVTASVWAVMMMGIPMMVVNGDVVQQKVSNDPGQVIRVFGSAEDVNSAVRYVQPPNFSPQFDANIASLISNTMSQAGANDAALGNLNPDNTSAIIALREAATMPMQTMQRHFYAFVEDVARIWAEFWVTQYGPRSLKIVDDSGTWYLPFDGSRYADTLISVRADVGASTLWSEAQSVQTLDNLFERQVITPLQYLSRLPKGAVPDLSGLLREMKEGAAVDGLPAV